MIGHREVPGRPAIYATTRQFLDDLNLRSLEELPALDDLGSLVETAPATPEAPPEGASFGEGALDAADDHIEDVAAEAGEQGENSAPTVEEPHAAEEALEASDAEDDAAPHDKEHSGSVEISADGREDENGDLPPSSADGLHGHFSTRLH